MTYSKRFVVKPGAKVNLRKVDPSYVDPDMTEQDALAVGSGKIDRRSWHLHGR